MREYSSFEEIDRDLKILNLQKQIDLEQVKLSIDHTKEGLSPVYLVGSAANAVARKIVLYTTVAKVVGKRLLARV